MMYDGVKHENTKHLKKRPKLELQTSSKINIIMEWQKKSTIRESSLRFIIKTTFFFQMQKSFHDNRFINDSSIP